MVATLTKLLNLPTLTFALATLSFVLVLPTHARSDEAASGAGQGSAVVERKALDGRQLLQTAAQRLADYPTISARIRQRISMFDQRLVGAGSYQQSRIGRAPMWRIQLSAQAGGEDFRFERISNGRTLWMFQKSSTGIDPRRVDLQRVRDRFGAAGGLGLFEFSALSDMIASLNRHFDFEAPESIEVSKVAMWRLEGKWNPEALHAIVGAARLPPHLPDRVALALGKEDQVPYRIEYWRDAPEGSRKPQLLMAIELYEVGLGIAVDPAIFHPPHSDFVDDTNNYIKTRQRMFDAKDVGRSVAKTSGSPSEQRE